jgi:gluconokinase
MIVLVMGVSGSGKNTVGEVLAERLGFEFIDGDDYHPAENVAKMAAGTPLTDADRWPWLDRLNSLLKGKTNAVLACSALKAAYRERLRQGIHDFRIVYLEGSEALIAKRVAARKHRYMPASLLASQFAALEPPRDAITVNVGGTPEEAVAEALRQLR